MKKKLLVSVILTVAILLGLVSVANSAVIAILSVVRSKKRRNSKVGCWAEAQRNRSGFTS